MNTNVKFCSKCGKPSKVIDSMCGDGSVRRIRHCPSCFLYWETVEVIVEGSDRISLQRERHKERR